MKTRRTSLLLAILIPAMGVAAADYPATVFDPTSPATKRDTCLEQSEHNQVLDEIGATETEIGTNFARHGKWNLIRNGGMLLWPAGTSAAPDKWALSGAGATVTRQSDAEDGPYSARITAGTASSKLQQTVIATISATQNQRLRGLAVTLVAYVKTSVASAGRLEIYDGVGSSQSSYHTGGGAWERLAIKRVMDASATELTVRLLDDATDSVSTVKFSSVMLLEGEFQQRAFLPHPADLRPLVVNTTAGSTGANTNATTLISFPVPPILLQDGDTLEVRAWGATAANANNKTVTLYFGAFSVTTGALPLNNRRWLLYLRVTRTGSATQLAEGYIGSDDGTNLSFRVVGGSPAETLTGDVTAKIEGTNGTASAADITAYGLAARKL